MKDHLLTHHKTVTVKGTEAALFCSWPNGCGKKCTKESDVYRLLRRHNHEGRENAG